MSLIGPRPALPKEIIQYDERAMQRLRVKPGCGGAWQVSTRSDSSFEEMVDLDLWGIWPIAPFTGEVHDVVLLDDIWLRR